MKIHSTNVRVTYAHTDQMGIANNSRYLEYFEIGRTELLRDLGMSYKKVEELGIMLPLIEAHLKYIKAAKYDDLLTIKTYIIDIPIVKMKINYEIYVNDTKICEGYTIHAMVRTKDFKPIRTPDFFLKVLFPEALDKN